MSACDMSQAQGPVHKAIEDKLNAFKQILADNGARKVQADHAGLPWGMP